MSEGPSLHQLELHRQKAISLLELPALSDGFKLFDPKTVLHNLTQAQLEIGAAIKLLKPTPTPTPAARSKEAA